MIYKQFFDKLVDDIRIRANLGSPEATGFYAIHCPVCLKSDKKTGGFKFEDDKIIYNCFRGSCDASTVYEMGKPISRKFRNLMETLGVQIPPELRLVKSSLQKAISQEDNRFKKIVYSQISLDFDYDPIDESSHPNAEMWLDYLAERRIHTDDVILITSGQYRGLMGIMMFFYDRLIGVQIVTLKGVYISHYGGNTNVIYIPERRLDKTVILVEGAMDAKCFPNTVAVLGAKITPEQAYNLAGRNVIMIPEKGTSNRFIDQFSQYGWSISFPDWGDCKDLNDAVVKYGVIVVAKLIKNGIITNKLKADAVYKLWNK